MLGCFHHHFLISAFLIKVHNSSTKNRFSVTIYPTVSDTLNNIIINFIYNAPVPVLKMSSKHSTASHIRLIMQSYEIRVLTTGLGNTIASDKTKRDGDSSVVRAPDS